MNATDQQKLVNAGFKIIRKEEFNLNGGLRIKTKDSGGLEWRTLEKGFPTKAALDRRMKELLENDKVVED